MSDLVRTISELRDEVAFWRTEGHRVGLVPTMGFLHEGHLSLIENALGDCNRVITTIFVNPTQFGAHEDLDGYPKDLDRDLSMVERAGGHLVFVPNPAMMYPDGFATRVEVDGLTDIMDGAARPGHFNGVTQIVSKLLNQAQADVAVFGEKDWQQLAIIRRMAHDLDFFTEIRGAPIVRDAYGLALSSRNFYLDEDQLEVARKLNVILKKAAYDIAASEYPLEICKAAALDLGEAGFAEVDYVECRDAQTLQVVEKLSERPARLFAAAKIGKARLIDNVAVI
ncbi:MAG: pantoate--beta-alanine ligase [Pseudomonadota bacterium]